jgi:N-acetylglucosamine-6-phosphate deacetylase
MIVLSGADLVLPDRLLGPGSLVIDGDRIVEVKPGTVAASPGDLHVDLHGHYVVPGFIDVHVHGVQGLDSLDGPHAVRSMASLLPRYGVTAFCPTSVACSPSLLRRFLLAVRQARLAPAPGSARVLPAHLESNFLNPDYRGAQPVECLRLPPAPQQNEPGTFSERVNEPGTISEQGRVPYTGGDVLVEMERGQADIGIVTLASELRGAMDLIALMRRRGHLVSLGHSAADYEQARAAIAAGASQATHLFNRMPKMGHRHPGLAGAVLESEEVAAELVCDGYHVHPAMMRVAIGAKTPARMMAVTDATAGAGLPAGARVALGGQSLRVEDSASFLEDGTLAGSVLTMDKAFRMLIGKVGLSPVDAAILCATTAARELHLEGFGVLAPGAMADLAVLDAACHVMQTWIGGHLAFSALPAPR